MSASVRSLAKELLAAHQGDCVAAFREFLTLALRNDRRTTRPLAYLANRYATNDPRPYFFETLLQLENARERRTCGAFYTPGPLVSAIVNGVEQVFHERKWNAEKARIIDPACGSGVFLSALEASRFFSPAEIQGTDLSPAVYRVAASLVKRANVACCNPLDAGEEFLRELTANLNGPLVIVGNPPYSNYGRRNRNPWLDRLLRDYLGETFERKRNLHDDCIKFIRWAQEAMRRVECGVVSFVVNRTFLSGLTHGGMRASLANDFSTIDVLDLHGDGAAGDENVFGIRRGTAIVTLVKSEKNGPSITLRYRELHGTREEKFRRLLSDHDSGATYSLPRGGTESWTEPWSAPSRSAGSYATWPAITEIFPVYGSGVQTKNDHLFVGFSIEEITPRIREFLLAEERRPVFRESAFAEYRVAPWDRRMIYYEPRVLGRSRYAVMRHMLRENIGLVFMRQVFGVPRYDHILAVNGLVSDRIFASRRGAPFLAPLWLYEGEQRRANLREEWLARLQDCLNQTIAPLEALGYLYAVLHASAYRRTLDRELRVDFPRVPFPRGSTEFHELSAAGSKLIELHLGECDSPLHAKGTVPMRGKLILSERELHIGPDFTLTELDNESFAFHCGGVCVIEHFLKKRRGRTLSEQECRQLGTIVQVARSQPEIIAAIDRVGDDWFK